MTVLYDPPSGWKYGFPKEFKPLENESLRDTLIRDGYPKDLADQFGDKYCRFIDKQEEFNKIVNN